MPRLDVRRFDLQLGRQGTGVRANVGALAAPGRALQQVGAQLGAFAEQHRNAINRVEARPRLAQLQSDFLIELDARSADPTKHRTLLEDTDALGTQLLERALEGVDDPELQQAIQGSASDFFLGRRPHVSSLARRQATEIAQTDVLESLDRYRDIYTNATDGEAEQLALLGMQQAMEEAVNAGVIDPIKARAMFETTRDDAFELSILEQMQSNPQGVAELLNDDAQFQGLDPKRRLNLGLKANRIIEAQERERITRIERSERRAEKAHREQQDANLLDLSIALLQNPESVTPEALIAAAQSGALRGPQFNAIMKARDTALRTDNFVEDPVLKQNALSAVLNDDFDVERIMGLPLEPSSIEELIKLQDSVERRGGPLARREVKDSLNRIDDVIGGIRGPMAILDPAASERVSNAQQALVDAVLGDPDLDVTAATDTIISQFRLNPPVASSLPKPRFLVGSRGLPDIQETRKATVLAFRRGEITQDEFQEQAELLEELEEIAGQRGQ